MVTIVTRKNQPTWNKRIALGADDEAPRAMGELAKNQSQRLSHSANEYYGSSETLLQYPPILSSSLLRMNTSLIERLVRKQLGDTLTDIINLLTWDAGWDSYDAPEPNPKAVVRATNWIINFFQRVADLGWNQPNVTAGSEGEVVFEWWYGVHKLTIYIGEQYTEFVQVWDTDPHAKITDGDIESSDDYRALWAWLMD